MIHPFSNLSILGQIHIKDNFFKHLSNAVFWDILSAKELKSFVFPFRNLAVSPACGSFFRLAEKREWKYTFSVGKEITSKIFLARLCSLSTKSLWWSFTVARYSLYQISEWESSSQRRKWETLIPLLFCSSVWETYLWRSKLVGTTENFWILWLKMNKSLSDSHLVSFFFFSFQAADCNAIGI